MKFAKLSPFLAVSLMFAATSPAIAGGALEQIECAQTGSPDSSLIVISANVRQDGMREATTQAFRESLPREVLVEKDQMEADYVQYTGNNFELKVSVKGEKVSTWYAADLFERAGEFTGMIGEKLVSIPVTCLGSR